MSDLTKEQREEMDERWKTDTFELANLLSLAADLNVKNEYLGSLTRGYSTALMRNLLKLRQTPVTEALPMSEAEKLLRRIANAGIIFPSYCVNNGEAWTIVDELKKWKETPPSPLERK